MFFSGWLLMLAIGVLHAAGIVDFTLAYWHSVLVAWALGECCSTSITSMASIKKG